MRLMSRFMLLMSTTGLMAFSPLGYAAQPSYGLDINLEQAKKVANAASQQAVRMKLNVVIAIVDTAGHLVYFEKADDTQTASVEVAVAKAKSASTFRRSTKVFEDAVSKGRTAVLGLPGAVPIEGGVPIVMNKKIIGAIGISGASSEEDGVIAAAGVALVK